MSNRKKKTAPLPNNLTREAVLGTEAINTDDRTAVLSFASEEPYERWFGPEVLQVDESAMNLQRFTDGLGCLLYNHNRDDVIGHVDEVWLEENRAYARVRFDEDELSETVYQKVVSGTLKGVSVGYRIVQYDEVKIDETAANGRIKGPCYVASKWEPYEVSIVTVPADASVGVGRELDVDGTEQEGAVTMGEKARVENNSNVPVMPTVDEAAVRQAERERCIQIEALCRQFGVDASEYIERGDDLATAQRAVFEKARAATPPPANVGRVEMGEVENAKIRAAMTDGLLMRAGISVEKPAEGAAEMRGRSLRSIMEEVLERDGVRGASRMADEDLIRSALTGTGALPGILSNVANKSMAKAYEDAPTTFQYFTSVGSNSDFKEASVYRLSEAGDLKEIKENGEFIHDELTEDSARKKVLTFGRSFSFTRQMIMNDDLGALTRIPSLYAASAKRGINRLVYQVLSDKKLYSAKNGNTAATGGALSLETLEAGRVAMRTQKNLRGKAVLNIMPQFLIVPTSKEFLARQLMHSTADPAATNSGVVNPLHNSLTIISDAELDAISPDAWYLAASPQLADTIEVTYLNGVQTPQIESQVAFDMLGIRYRVYMDYGVTALDFKGLYKNAGK